MLADKFHPVIANKATDILSVMNDNNLNDIHYDIASYEVIEKLDISRNDTLSDLLQGKQI